MTLSSTHLLQAGPGPDRSSTFDNLPNELMSTIFEFYTSDLAFRTTPLTLGAITQRWRDIAWSTPRLWTTLFFSSGYRQSSLAARIQLAEEWLHRSGTLPLSIWIHVLPPSVEEQHRQLYYALVEALNQHCSQWHVLDLKMPRDVLSRLSMSESGCSSPRIKELTLASDTHGEISFPSLSRLKPARVVCHRIQLTHGSLTWSSVTHCSIAFLKADRILELLRAAPCLSQCQFESVQRRDIRRGREEVEHVTHSHLESLRINFSYHEAETYVLNNMTLPALKHLDIRAVVCDFHVEPLISLLTRSSCRLRSLTIQEHDYLDEELVSVLQVLPSLEILHILSGFAEENHEEAFYAALIGHLPTEETPIPRYSQPLLASLRHFSWVGYGAFHWNALLNLLAPLDPDSNRTRPLELIDVQCIREEEDPIPYIGRDAVEKILKLKGRVGFKLLVEDEEGDRKDLLEMSLGLLNGDKTYNSTLLE